MATTSLNAISTAEVKAYHGYTGTDKDSIIDVIRPLVADFIESYCRHDFLQQARTNEKPVIPQFRNAFYLKYYPIDLGQTFTLTEDGQTLTRNTDYFVDADTGRVEKIKDLDNIFQSADYVGYWSTTRDGVVVTAYTGGVDLANAQDVVMVFYEIVGIRAGIKKRTFTNNEGVENVVFLNSAPKELLKILDRYKHRNLTVSGVRD
jgi:hypothetical protein